MLIEKSHIKKKMGFKDRLNSVKTAFTGVPNQSLISMARAFMPTLGEPPRRSAEEWLKLYNKSPRMGSIHLIASHIGSATYGIYNNDDPKKIKIRNHAMEQLFKKPNEDVTMTEFTLFYLTQAYLLLPSGEAFWLKEKNGLGIVTQLWPIPPHWVSEIPSRTKPYFTVQPLGNMQSQPIYVPPFDMVYFKRPDVTNPYLRGVGKAENIGDELETDEYMAKFSKRYFFNGAIPDMVGMMPGAGEEEVNRTEEVWSQKYGGLNNAHKTAWLNFDAKFQILKETNKDLEYINSRKFLSDAVRQFFNIPPELFGDVSNSNRSTIDSAFYLFAKNCLRNELTFICDVINRQLTPDFSNAVYFEHDEIVPEDNEFKLKQASEGLKNGGILVDEWRMANSFEPLPNGKGQILYTPLNMIPTSLTEEPLPTNLPAREPPEESPPKKELKALTIEQKQRMWHVLDKAAVKNERSFINALKKYFQSQQDKINKALEKSVKQATDEPDELLDWHEEETILLGVLTPLWMASLKEGFDVVNITFSFGLTDDFMQPKFLEWINQFGAEQVKDITDTTKGKLRKTLSEGIAEGESIPKLRDRVSAVMTEAKTSRTEKIARTETHNTVGAGTYETYGTANVQQKEWLVTIDGRERDSHAALNGEVVGIEQPFSNSLMYPGDPSGPAEEVINCRCTLLPVLD